MWFLNTMYLSLIFVHVALAAAFTTNLSNSTVDFPVASAHQNGTNSNAAYEALDIKIFKNSDLYLNVVGFREFLERSLQRKVLDYTLSPLTKLGDNWSSVVQALEVKLIDSHDANQIETLHLVCKITDPATIQYTDLDFEREIHFFSNIVPAIVHFEEIENIPQVERIDNAFPKYFGHRLSLNSSATKADRDAILLLENLKFSNYVNRDRRSRLDRNETMATLKVLAKMHALGISMRRKQPVIFNSQVKGISPYLQTSPMGFSRNLSMILVDELRSVFTNYPEKVLAEIEQQVQPAGEYFFKIADSHTAYTTICHRDLWITNVMFKNDNSGVDGAIQVKLLDFQRYLYESFANDLVFFLLVNAPLDDLRTDFRSFIEYYHLEFMKTLQHVNIPLDDYTYEKMWNEIRQKAKIHLMRFLFRIKLQHTTVDGSISKRGLELFQYITEQPVTDIVLIQWRCIIDLFIENEFI